MPDLLRQEIATAAHTIVVKVGTRVLTGAGGTLNQQRVAALAEELHQVMATGRKVVLVTSGAVGAGMGQLGLAKRPTNLAQLQAVAAVGQSHLIEAYDRGLRAHGRHAAQLLLTAEDLDDRTRYLNVRNTIRSLFEFGAVPIINENDTVSVDELRTTFGDNDRLAAMVTNLMQAPLLGAAVGRRRTVRRRSARARLAAHSTVTRLDDQILGLVRDQKTGLSKGGMASKLNAARIATTAGENVIIANGREPGNLAKILAGELVGTHLSGARSGSAGLEALDRLHGAAPRLVGARRRRAAPSKARDAACWRSAWSMRPANSRRETSWRCGTGKGRNSPAA